ncbi:16585_t:CDS:1, partial [Funneliformis geosporum]
VFEKIVFTEEFSGISDFTLNQSKWKILEEIVFFLKCFAKLSTEMCSSKYPTINDVYPMYNHIMKYTEKTMKQKDVSKNIYNATQAV